MLSTGKRPGRGQASKLGICALEQVSAATWALPRFPSPWQLGREDEWVGCCRVAVTVRLLYGLKHFLPGLVVIEDSAHKAAS